MQIAMFELRKILVAFDLTEMDHKLASYLFSILPLIEPAEVNFVHIVNRLPLDEVFQTAEGSMSREQIVRKKMAETIAAADTEGRMPSPTLIVASDEPLNGLLSMSHSVSADLLIIGRKGLEDSEGLFCRRLVRRALCSVLCVTENARPKVGRIVVPTDFTDFSARAISRVLEIAGRFSMHLVCLHIFKLPNGYLASGKTQEEFGQIMKTNAEKRYRSFIKKLPVGNATLTPRFQLDSINATPKIIFNIALVEDADLLIMASRGRTDLAAWLLGSRAEKLLQYNFCIPTLVFKQKKRNLSFIEALLRI